MFSRRTRVPDELKAQLGHGERVIAWGSGPDGPVGASDRALYARGERIPWHLVERARWEAPVLHLTVAGAGPLRLDLDQPRDLPQAVRACVTDSVVVSERVDLGNGRGALMAARRDGDSGEVRWSVVFDAGLNPQDPALQALARQRLAALRQSLGI